MTVGRHPDKHIQAALEFAYERGWTARTAHPRSASSSVISANVADAS